MLHVLVILMLASIAMHDSLRSGPGIFGGYYDSVTGWWTLPLTLVPMAVLAALAWLASRAGAAMLDSGRVIGADLAERACSAARVGAVCLFAADVLILGWLDAVRSVFGDLVIIDELIALLPPLAVFAASWAAQHIIESRIRRDIIMRELDTGEIMYPIPSRGRFVFTQLRHQVMLSLIPILMLMGWAECAERAADWLADHRAVANGLLAWVGGLTANRETRPGVLFGVQLVGVAVVLSFAPLALRYVWDTVRLSPGPLRDRLVEMCREHDIGVRELLVWRTHGSMINGAVMGIWGRLRYILLTDALLDAMPREQVEAVMAHELGHVHHRHVPWLIGVMLGSLMVLAMAGSGLLWLYAVAAPAPEDDMLRAALWGLGAMGLDVTLMIAILAGAILIFTFVSRRFEWQADAFAAKHLSGGPIVTSEGVAGMASALQSVGRLNNIPLRRGSWRHGSLGDRIRRLGSIAGRPADALPIDKAVRRIKLFAAGMIALAMAALVASIVLPMVL